MAFKNLNMQLWRAEQWAPQWALCMHTHYIMLEELNQKKYFHTSIGSRRGGECFLSPWPRDLLILSLVVPTKRHQSEPTSLHQATRLPLWFEWFTRIFLLWVLIWFPAQWKLGLEKMLLLASSRLFKFDLWITCGWKVSQSHLDVGLQHPQTSYTNTSSSIHSSSSSFSSTLCHGVSH